MLEYKEIIYVRYDESENRFYDDCGFYLSNMFELITPNDLFMFHKDHTCCVFPYRYDYQYGLRIIIETDPVWD